MSAADSIRAFVEPIVPGWAVQLGLWRDGGPTHRAVVIKPAGGISASLIREPQFTVLVVGGVRDTSATVLDVCETISAAIRSNTPAGLVNCTISEPSFFQTAEHRPAYELALSAMLSY